MLVFSVEKYSRKELLAYILRIAKRASVLGQQLKPRLSINTFPNLDRMGWDGQTDKYIFSSIYCVTIHISNNYFISYFY